MAKDTDTAAEVAIASRLFQEQRYSESITAFEQALAQNKDPLLALDIYRSLAVIYLCLAQPERGYRYLQKVVASSHYNAMDLNNIALCALKLGRSDEAKQFLLKSLELNPVDSTYNNLGNLYTNLNLFPEAAQAFDHALALNPSNHEVHNNYGILWQKQGQTAAAITAFKQAITYHSSVKYCLNLGKVYKFIGSFEAAIEQFQACVTQDTRCYQAYAELGDTKRLQTDLNAAETYLLMAHGLNPDFADGQLYLGILYRAQKKYHLALPYLQKAAHTLGTTSLTSLCELAYTELSVHNWPAWQTHLQHITDLITHNHYLESANPFDAQACGVSLSHLHQVARTWSAQFAIRRLHAPYQHTRTKSVQKRIVIGYLSPDFADHPVALLLKKLFALHDRQRFCVYGFSTILPTRENTSELTTLATGFDQYFDLSNKTAHESAALIHGTGVDILIDLAGPTSNSSMDILCYQPAPLQAHLIGYTGTLGSPYINYLITHEDIVQESHLGHFDENIVYLPETDLATQGFRQPQHLPAFPGVLPPEDAFVYLCHHQPYRLEPEILSAWFTILSRVPKGVLWILCRDKICQERLIDAAKKQDIDPSRLYFYEVGSLTVYWQHLKADVFLDTFTYTSGTGVFIAAWSGLPVLTYTGDTPQANVAACYCRASQVPEQVVTSKTDYIEKAITWGQNPQQVAALKAQLLQCRMTSPLFNTERYARHLELAYEDMIKHYCSKNFSKVIYSRTIEDCATYDN